MRSIAYISDIGNGNGNGSLQRSTGTSERESKLVQALIDASGSSIVVLDENRTVVFANRAWREFAARAGSLRGKYGIGKKYPDFFTGIASASGDDTRAMRNGLERMIANEEIEFQMKYQCTAFAQPLWFVMHAASFAYPLMDSRQLIVVSHDPVSENNEVASQDEQSLLRLLKTSNILPWEADADSDHFSYVGEQAKDLLGYATEQWRDEGFWSSHIHPEDRERVLEEYSRLSETTDHFKYEYRMMARDGRVVWVQDIVDVAHRPARPATMHGFMMDITERKEAESALIDLSGRLITAQEEERKRIARELHDDLNQRIALISIELEQVLQRSDNDPKGVPVRVNQIKRKLTEISTQIHRMSYELHPSKLDHLGLLPALKSFCSDLAESRGVRIDLQHKSLPTVMSRDVTLCVFRVAQEAIQNAAKYSGADVIKVSLVGSDTSIELSVTDDGNGFSTRSEKMTKGLGITSMQERARLARGKFNIASEPGCGCIVRISVPLTPVLNTNPLVDRKPLLRSTIIKGVPSNETYTHSTC